MKKVISVVIVLIVCLSTLIYAKTSGGASESGTEFHRNKSDNNGARILPMGVIGCTNEGWVVAREGGVEIISFIPENSLLIPIGSETEPITIIDVPFQDQNVTNPTQDKADSNNSELVAEKPNRDGPFDCGG